MRRGVILVAAVLVAVAVGWLLLVRFPRRYGGPTTHASAATAPTAPSPPGRKIKARLFYVTDDGLRLTGVERDVPFGEGTVEQARQIIEAQIAPVADPVVSAIPPGTKLRALFVTERGEAYVDLTQEVVTAHTGGSIDELLTVYSLIDALTVNLPAVTSVQLLVNGKEVETLAGHVDLRRPLAKNVAWVQ